MAEHRNGDVRNPKDANQTPSAGPSNVSRLGLRLRELSDKALASGTKTLSLEEIHKLISEARGRSI